MLHGYRFRPRLVTTLAAVAGIAATLALAHWQLGRAHEKEALRQRLELLARDAPVALSPAQPAGPELAWRRVTARGSFDPRHAVYIDNRLHRGTVGYHVVMPLALGADRFVLVNRGWIAGTGDRSRLPAVTTPPGTVEVSGLAVVPGRRFFELRPDTIEGRVWQNLTVERYRRETGIAVLPVMIEQDSALDDGLVRAWDPPDLGIDRHYGYAFQWSALAVAILVIWVVTNLRRPAHPAP